MSMWCCIADVEHVWSVNITYYVMNQMLNGFSLHAL